MLKLSTFSYKVYDLRTRVNPVNLLPYFSKLETVQSKRYFYQHSYTFEKSCVMKTHISTCLPLVPGSQIERSFLTLIYTYMELDTTIEPLQEIFVNPIRIPVWTHSSASVQSYIDPYHSGMVCISRENVTGGMYQTSEFQRELMPVELYIGPSPNITSLEYFQTNVPEAYMDMVVFSKNIKNKIQP